MQLAAEHDRQVDLMLGPDAARDAAWVAAARQGDASAFRQLYDAYARSVYHIALRMVGNAEDAADLTQETFIRAYRQLPQLRDAERFDRWIRTIATNLCRDYLKRVRPTVYSLDAPPPGHTDLEGWELPSPTPDGETQYLSEEFRTALARGIQALSADHRAVLVLHHLEGRPVEEISAMLRIPLGTVKSRLARARGELRRVLEPYVTASE